MQIKAFNIHVFFMWIIAVFSLNTCLFSATLSVPSGKTPSISKAMAGAKKGDTVIVAPGTYREHIFVTPGVVLVSQSLFKASIDGNGKGTVVTMGNGSVISGFEIRSGTIGIFSTTANVTISQCRIMYNEQTGIMCVGNLPGIEDNLVVFNKGSGIQGWDVRSTSSAISHNTIAFNSNNGISVGGNSSIIVENCIIAFNDQYGIKPVEDAVKIDLKSNTIYENAKFSGTLPQDNFSFDPAFIDSKKLNFMLGSQSQCVGKGSDNQNLGARIVY